MDEYSCEHTDAERGFVCSCTSLELNAALEDGYVVTKVLRVLEYEKSDDQLFRPYIRYIDTNIAIIINVSAN